jgi:hypothetical protein
LGDSDDEDEESGSEVATDDEEEENDVGEFALPSLCCSGTR